MPRHCAGCSKTFEPRPQVPDQAYCSSPECQRARKRQWQKDKLRTDSDYQANQRAAQRAWSARNGSYWRDRQVIAQRFRRVGVHPQREDGEVPGLVLFRRQGVQIRTGAEGDMATTLQLRHCTSSSV